MENKFKDATELLNKVNAVLINQKAILKPMLKVYNALEKKTSHKKLLEYARLRLKLNNNKRDLKSILQYKRPYPRCLYGNYESTYLDKKLFEKAITNNLPKFSC